MIINTKMKIFEKKTIIIAKKFTHRYLPTVLKTLFIKELYLA